MDASITARARGRAASLDDVQDLVARALIARLRLDVGRPHR
jgi:hypothetical protein